MDARVYMVMIVVKDGESLPWASTLPGDFNRSSGEVRFEVHQTKLSAVTGEMLGLNEPKVPPRWHVFVVSWQAFAQCLLVWQQLAPYALIYVIVPSSHDDQLFNSPMAQCYGAGVNLWWADHCLAPLPAKIITRLRHQEQAEAVRKCAVQQVLPRYYDTWAAQYGGEHIAVEINPAARTGEVMIHCREIVEFYKCVIEQYGADWQDRVFCTRLTGEVIAGATK